MVRHAATVRGCCRYRPRCPALARRGLRHRLVVILGLAVCAVLAGARSFTAIAEWAADADQATQDALGITGVVPCESTSGGRCSTWTLMPSMTRPAPGTKWSTETIYAITSLTAIQAGPAELADIARGHWLIEDRLHWVRSPGTGLAVASCGTDATRVSFSC